jgi:hypothetical protein
LLRIVAISVIIGTFLIGTYYVVAASYIQPIQQDKIADALGEVQMGLTYERFVSLGEDERSALVQQMPSSTITMLLQEARSHPSFIAEKTDAIKAQSGSNEIRLVKLSQISGLKGYDSKGEAAIMISGDKIFLRLQEFGVTSGIDQHLYLTKDGTIATGIDLGRLKASQGDQYYDITGIDIELHNILIIYSKVFDTYYAHAKFLKTQ